MHTLDRGVPSQEHESWHSQLVSQPRCPLALSSHLRWQRWSCGPAPTGAEGFRRASFAFDLSLSGAWPDGRDPGPAGTKCLDEVLTVDTHDSKSLSPCLVWRACRSREQLGA